MNIRKKTKQLGFTLIELVIVIIILGILAAIAIPRFVSLTDEAKVAAAAGFEGAVKSSYAIYLAKNQGAFPTVQELAAYIQGDQHEAIATGISTTIGGDAYLVPTYTNSDCTGPTATSTATVGCLGTIAAAA